MEALKGTIVQARNQLQAYFGMRRKTEEKPRELPKSAIMLALLMSEERPHWHTLDRTYDYCPYDNDFQNVLNGKTLAQLVQERRDKVPEVLVLDFMGYGKPLRRLPLTGGLAVALEDPRNEAKRQEDIGNNIGFVQGNVLQRSTWNKISEWLESQRTSDKKFQLILARPSNGFNCLSADIGLPFVLLQRAWQLLSFDNGMLFTQVPTWIFPNTRFSLDVEDWVEILNRTRGVEARFSRSSVSCSAALSLIKRKDSPATLPRPRIFKSDNS